MCCLIRSRAPQWDMRLEHVVLSTFQDGPQEFAKKTSRSMGKFGLFRDVLGITRFRKHPEFLDIGK